MRAECVEREVVRAVRMAVEEVWSVVGEVGRRVAVRTAVVEAAARAREEAVVAAAAAAAVLLAVAAALWEAIEGGMAAGARAMVIVGAARAAVTAVAVWAVETVAVACACVAYACVACACVVSACVASAYVASAYVASVCEERASGTDGRSHLGRARHGRHIAGDSPCRSRKWAQHRRSSRRPHHRMHHSLGT